MPRDVDELDLPPGRPDPLARALARLDPAPPALNRDRLMFDAGAQSRRPAIRLWQLTAGLMAAVGFAAGLNWRPPVAAVREQVATERGIPPARPGADDRSADEPVPPKPAAAVGRPWITPAGAGYWLRREHEALGVVLAIIPDRSRVGYRAPRGGS